MTEPPKRRLSTRNFWIILVSAFLLLGSVLIVLWPRPVSESELAALAAAPTPTVFVPTPVPVVRHGSEGSADDNYNQGAQKTLYAGRSYLLAEASTDEAWANTLILARTAGNTDGIKTAYDQDGYLHFSPRVMCLVVDQPERSRMQAVQCVIQQGDHKGETVYASAIGDGSD